MDLFRNLNNTIMLTETQQHPLLDEAKKWLDHLVTYVTGINELKNTLYKWAAGKSDHDVLIQIEHYHNQFHIQLINLHDLKHDIRQHMKEVNHMPETDQSERHQELNEQYQFLVKDLDQLKADFLAFTAE